MHAPDDLFGFVPPPPRVAAPSLATVYIVQTAAGGPVKIGVTRDLERRMQAYRTAAVEPRLLRTMPGSTKTERWMHNRFKGQHIAREWFYFAPEMLTVEPPAESLPEVRAATDLSFRALLRRAWPTGTARNASRASGISQRTTEDWVTGTARPDATVLLRMMVADQRFSNAVEQFVADQARQAVGADRGLAAGEKAARIGDQAEGRR